LSGVGAGQIVRIQLVVEGTNGLNTTDSCTRLEVLDSITPDKLALGLVLGPWRQRNGAVIWLTGLSGAGKTTLAQAVASRLRVKGIPAALLDGDAVRNHLSSGLGYTREDRDENICRIAFAASAIEGQGSIVLVSAISPYRAAREHARQRAKTFIEVYVNAPIEVCEARDVKGLYRRARSGEILEMAGLTSPYEPPAGPDVECQTDNENVEVSTNKILRALSTRGIICI
jgi:adenylylsulfate kinase